MAHASRSMGMFPRSLIYIPAMIRAAGSIRSVAISRARGVILLWAQELQSVVMLEAMSGDLSDIEVVGADRERNP